MKTTKFQYTFLFLLFVGGLLSSCVQDDDFDLPNTSVTPPEIDGEIVDIASVLGTLAQNNNEQYTYENTDKYMEGYVISSDEGGNFFREIILQDQPENPTAGIKVALFVNPLYTKYEIGRKIYVKLEGFTVGISNGVATLGIPDGDFMQEAPAQFENNIVRDTVVADIVPLELQIADFSDEYENLFIKLNDMQFPKSIALGENALTYAAEPFDEFDGERTLESCATGNTTILTTSTFADFKDLDLATGKGSISGILTRNFEDTFFTLKVNDVSDIQFDSEERCDPEVLECEGPFGGSDVLFSEDFEGYSNFSEVEATGWINVNISGGSTEFVLGNFNNNNYAQISGFNSGEDEITTYLVSPEINLDSSTEEALTFDLEVAFANGKILKVLITENFTGDVTTTDWTQVDVAIPNEPSSGFGGFENVGNINISCLEGNIRVAFLYEGSDPNATTRYHIDNFEVNGVL